MCSYTGAIGIRFKLKDSDTSWTFVSAHLAAHDYNVLRRNLDWQSIVSRMVFHENGQALQIYYTSYLFVFGDLNYRISVTSPRALPLHDISDRIRNDRDALLQHDQLLHEQKGERTLHGLQEGRIAFQPSYKYKVGTDDYKVCRVRC